MSTKTDTEDTTSRGPRNRKILTDLAIGRMRPPARQELIWDTAQSGLALLISPGGTKSFISQFKLDGKWQRRTLGRVGEVTVDNDENANVAWAREQVRKDRIAAKAGTDPRKPKPTPQELEIQAKQEAGPTFKEVLDDFIDLYAKKRQRTWKETKRTLEVNCKQWLDRPIREITQYDAQELIDAYVKAGKGPTAHVTLAWLRTMWTFAWKRNKVAEPFMDKIDADYEKRVRDRVFSDDEITAIWKASEQLKPTEQAYIKLLLLLAPRKSALAGMLPTHVDDIDNPTLWTTPFELTKSRKSSSKKRVYLTPLPPLAQRIVKPLLKTDTRVFHEVLEHPSTTLRNKLIKAGAPADFTFHCIRHSVTTWFETRGKSEWERSLILNHSGSGVTQGYSHGAPLDLKRELLTLWSDHVEQLVAGQRATLLR